MAPANEQESTLPNAPAATPAGETEESTEGTETEQEAEGLLGEGEGEGTEPGEGDEDPTADFEEIELDGEKYSVPAKLKSAFLMQKDYTQKTQTVAEQAREVEARARFLDDHAKALEADAETRAKLLNAQAWVTHYSQFTPADWKALWNQDPGNHADRLLEFQNAERQRNELAYQLEKNARTRSETAQRDHATRIAKTVSELSHPIDGIKGWGKAIADAVTDYGVAQGFTREELTNIVDSRAIKVLHKAHLYDQLIAKQKSAPRAATNPQATVKPLKQVSKGASRPAASAEPTDKDSDEEWMRKRNAQLRKKSA